MHDSAIDVVGVSGAEVWAPGLHPFELLPTGLSDARDGYLAAAGTCPEPRRMMVNVGICGMIIWMIKCYLR